MVDLECNYTAHRGVAHGVIQNVTPLEKAQPYEQDERLLVQEGRCFLMATIFSLGSLTVIARPGDFWYAWLAGGLAFSVVFVPARPILVMAWHAIRRGIT